MVIAALKQVIEVQRKQIANFGGPGVSTAFRLLWSLAWSRPERGHYSFANYKTELEGLPPGLPMPLPITSASVQFPLAQVGGVPGRDGVGVGAA